ncbi:HDOD domain-containing protein [Marinobacterium weihaiense]|uniref:HDOD domain-containing protein n=1 Tax=Marinobacterium weihaiense TaxID=2851016 RepID=A0ABS6MEA3_9GAMM|nr:HDOD domain-containing protein [Marinobacterium weihaiense]MBV0934648.1 HDOD domain-containing protein [Marinobacterium weihaiense]
MNTVGDTRYMTGTTFNSLIPPQPEILLQLARECRREDPNLERICTLIGQDVAIYAAILKVVNSPYYGLSVQVTSIRHAISLLGIVRVFNLARLTMLHNTLSQTGRMERFWDTARDVSQVAVTLTRHFALPLDPDEMQALGMLHDCGLPLMVQAFDGFRDCLHRSSSQDPAALHRQELLQFRFSHYQVGARMVERWLLPAHLADAIRLQPVAQDALCDRIKVDEQALYLLAALALAQDVSAEYRYFWRVQADDRRTTVNAALAFLGIVEYDFLNFKESLIDAWSDNTVD